MLLGVIANKPYGTSLALEDRNLVLGPQVAYQRETTLAPNWLCVRVALVISFTNLTELNGEPSLEAAFDAINSPRANLWIGFTNGLGFPADSGVKFVGQSRSDNNDGRLTLSRNSGWRLTYGGDTSSTNGMRQDPVIGDGATIYRGGNGSDSPSLFSTPAGVDRFALGVMLEFNLRTGDGRLFLSRNTMTDVSDPILALNRLIVARATVNVSSGGVGGGWWAANGSVPVGCRHLFIFSPFLQNRLRIHALRVMQVA